MIYGRGSQVPTSADRICAEPGQALLGAASRTRPTRSPALLESAADAGLDADAPDLPEQFHEIVKWRRSSRSRARTAPSPTGSSPRPNIRAMYRQLVNEQTRPVEMGDSLA
jgi:hypothetical protein